MYDGTDPLQNPKHEAFAQAIATGMSLLEAYAKAGYSGHGSNARRLRSDDAVRVRIDAVQRLIADKVADRVATEATYSREDAYRDTGRVLEMALSSGQLAAANGAIRLRTEIFGVKAPGEGAQLEEGHVAKSLEDPQVVADILNINKARKLMVVGGKDKA
jgi:hypothetical protein